jgi:hypothetical protein
MRRRVPAFMLSGGGVQTSLVLITCAPLVRFLVREYNKLLTKPFLPKVLP